MMDEQRYNTKNITLISVKGNPVDISVEMTQEGVALIECSEPLAFMTYLDIKGKVNANCYLRGIAIPGEGAFFDLFDRFGSIMRDVMRLSDKKSKDLLLSKIC